jgi:hypothetical protein
VECLGRSHVHGCPSFLYIDDSFADLTGSPTSLTDLGKEIRSRILKHTGIPAGVGIAHTKTLAKLANHTAKKLQNLSGGVADICDPVKGDWVPANPDWAIRREFMSQSYTKNWIRYGLPGRTDKTRSPCLQRFFRSSVDRSLDQLGQHRVLVLPKPEDRSKCSWRLEGMVAAMQFSALTRTLLVSMFWMNLAAYGCKLVRARLK